MPVNFTYLWIVACAAGELTGFFAAVFIGWYFDIYEDAYTLSAKLQKLFYAMLAGFAEGGCLAAFQWAVLRKKYPLVKFRSWFMATATVAVCGWILGMIYPVFFAENGGAAETAFNPSTGGILVMALAMGLILGAVFGFGQWLVLRKHANHSTRWITANALGWGLGMVLIFAAASIPGQHTAVELLWGIYITAGLLAGLSVGTITGLFFRHIPSH